ncbi:MAG TPA: sigma-70 family RNA polymerase sigma factor [Acidimicrobiales bacterium]
MRRLSRRRGGGAPPAGTPSWEEVARHHGDFVYTVAYRLTGNHHDAQDLVQEVLLRVQRGLATFRPGSIQAWLGRITTNAFLDDWRRRRRRPVVSLPDDPDLVVPSAPSVDEAIAARALPDDVAGALAALPPDYRATVVLCDVVGLRYEEISDELGVPVGTVRSRLHRGRALLRAALPDAPRRPGRDAARSGTRRTGGGE